MIANHRTHLVLSLLLTLLFVGSLSADDERLPLRSKVADEQLRRWASDLDEDQFAVRNAAMRRLRSSGVRGVAVVAEAAKASRTEGSLRAFQLLREFLKSHNDATADAALSALEQLSSGPKVRVANRARGVLDWHSSFIRVRAIADIERYGGEVKVHNTIAGPSSRVSLTSNWTGGDQGLALLKKLEGLSWLSFEHAPITNDGLKYIQGLSELEYLYLGHTNITGAGFGALEGMERMRYLSLEGLPIGEEGMLRVSGLKQLEFLGLDSTDIDDSSAAYLRPLTSLRTLWLSNTMLTDKGLVHLTNCKQLNRLYLEGAKVGGPGLAALQELPNLDYLSLKRVALDERAVKYIGQIKKLRTLGLDHTDTSDAMLGHLSGLENLTVLWLSKTQVSDAGIEHLKKLAKLRTVFLHGAKVTPQGAANLKSALPRCNVHR